MVKLYYLGKRRRILGNYPATVSKPKTSENDTRLNQPLELI
jgi:hypothetical protein